MDFNKIHIQAFSPNYQKDFTQALNDKSITSYVSFSCFNSNIILYENELIGFCKIAFRNDDLSDREISIAIIPKYRRHGIAKYIINLLCTNIFTSMPNCNQIHLSIDIENQASINMAENLGFQRNLELETELRASNDYRTLIYTIKNRTNEDKKAR